MKLGITINFDGAEVPAREAALETIQSLAGVEMHGISLKAALFSGRKSDEADLKYMYENCRGTVACLLKDKASVAERFNAVKDIFTDCDYLMFVQAGCTFKPDFFAVLAQAVQSGADVIKGVVRFKDSRFHAEWIDRYIKNERAFALKDLDALIIKRSVFAQCSLSFDNKDNAFFTSFCFKLFHQDLGFMLEPKIEVSAPYPMLQSADEVDRHFKIFDFIVRTVSKLGELNRSAVLAALTVESLCLGDYMASLQLKLKYFKELQNRISQLANDKKMQNGGFSIRYANNVKTLMGGYLSFRDIRI